LVQGEGPGKRRFVDDDQLALTESPPLDVALDLGELAQEVSGRG